MPWLQMHQDQKRRPSTGEGIVNAASLLGTAMLNRKDDEEEGGAGRSAGSVLGAQPNDAMLRRKPEMLDLLRGI